MNNIVKPGKAETAILGENGSPRDGAGSRDFKSLKTRAKVSVKPNRARISRINDCPASFFVSSTKFFVLFDSTLTNALQTVERFKIRSTGSISDIRRELLDRPRNCPQSVPHLHMNRYVLQNLQK